MIRPRCLVARLELTPLQFMFSYFVYELNMKLGQIPPSRVAREKRIFFKVREKSVNFVIGQGNLEFSSKSGNI